MPLSGGNSPPLGLSRTYDHSRLEYSGSRQISHDKPASADLVVCSVTAGEDSVLYVFFFFPSSNNLGRHASLRRSTTKHDEATGTSEACAASGEIVSAVPLGDVTLMYLHLLRPMV